MSDLEDTRGYYEHFAQDYAADESATYLAWARGVAGDAELLGRLAELDPPRRQPNLLFAAARWHGAPAPGPYERMREVVLDRWSDVAATMRARSTQTNEPGRCATLLPVLHEISREHGRPLALLEVGVSGGLCLYPDRYAHRYLDADGETLAVAGTGRPTFDCVVTRADGTPVGEGGGPAFAPAVPEVRWRGGLDLNPLDVADPDTLAWLRTLVWPEHDDRLARLDAAVEEVADLPRTLVRGDAAADPASLGELMARARQEAPDARLVVLHTAVVAYFEDEHREAWPRTVLELCAEHDSTWVSNEAPVVLPGVAATAGVEPPAGRMCLAVDGRARAWAHGHGRSLALL